MTLTPSTGRQSTAVRLPRTDVGAGTAPVQAVRRVRFQVLAGSGAAHSLRRKRGDRGSDFRAPMNQFVSAHPQGASSAGAMRDRELPAGGDAIDPHPSCSRSRISLAVAGPG